jgi:hypothetical protein
MYLNGALGEQPENHRPAPPRTISTNVTESRMKTAVASKGPSALEATGALLGMQTSKWRASFEAVSGADKAETSSQKATMAWNPGLSEPWRDTRWPVFPHAEDRFLHSHWPGKLEKRRPTGGWLG